MRNILNIDLTNINCNGVCSSACGSNCSEMILNVKGLELIDPYLEFQSENSGDNVTEEAEGREIVLTNTVEQPFVDIILRGEAECKNKLNVPKDYIIEGALYNQPLELPAGTYTLSVSDFETNGTSTRHLITFKMVDGSSRNIYLSSTTKVATITFASDVNKYNIYSQDGAANSTNYTTTYKELMIEEGTVASGYELYNSIKIKVTNGLDEGNKEQTVFFPLGTKQGLEAGEYITNDGIHKSNGAVTSFTGEQQTAWNAIKSLTAYSKKTIITSNAILSIQYVKYVSGTIETDVLVIINDEIYFEIPEDLINNKNSLIITLKDSNGYQSNEFYIKTVEYTSYDELICKYNSGVFEYSVCSGDKTIFDKIYPIGSIYFNVADVNPSELFGGTWITRDDLQLYIKCYAWERIA